MKRILWIAVIAITVVSCNKDQKAVKTLDGTWNATSYIETWNGSTEEFISADFQFKMMFSNCKLKDDEFCDITVTETYQGVPDVYVMEYRVVAGGTSLELREPDYPSELIMFKILELKKGQLKIEMDYGDNDIITITLEQE